MDTTPKSRQQHLLPTFSFSFHCFGPLIAIAVVSKHFYVCCALFFFSGKNCSLFIGLRMLGPWIIIISMRGHVLKFFSSFQVQAKVKRVGFLGFILKATFRSGPIKIKFVVCAEWKVRLAIWFELQSQSRYKNTTDNRQERQSFPEPSQHIKR